MDTRSDRLSSSLFNRQPFGGASMAFIALLISASAPAAAEQPPALAKFSGFHPLWPQTGGFCYIGFSHLHSKGPTDRRVYRELPSGEHVFVGDPVALGYTGPKFAYFGPHPLAVAGLPLPGTTYCYLRGPHFHASAPAPGPSFVLKNGAYWFVGEFSPQFEKDSYNVWMNDSPVLTEYKPPPVTLADAPPGYRLPEAVRVPPPAPAPLPVPKSASGRTGSRTAVTGRGGSR